MSENTLDEKSKLVAKQLCQDIPNIAKPFAEAVVTSKVKEILSDDAKFMALLKIMMS